MWAIVALIPPFIIYLYWRSALASNNGVIAGWNLSTISSYYFMLIVASSVVLAHIEEPVSKQDIQEGQLTRFILKPLPYFQFNLFTEVPYRILQGGFSLIALFLFVLVFGLSFAISTDPYVLLLATIITLLGFLICFTFKMIIGISALWLTDVGGFYQLLDGIMFVFGGFLLPLSLLPGGIALISYILPFSYMIYFPIVAFQGTQPILELYRIIGIQLLWFLGFLLLYMWLFKKGLKKFSGVGQ